MTSCSALLLGVLTLGMLTACDHSFLFDGEGNCPEVEPEPGPGPAQEAPTYWVQFVYDYNMAYADAFASQVSYVTLYVADTDGNIVWQQTEQGSALAQAGYMMEVTVSPGNYNLLAWCGTADKGSFSVASTSVLTGLQSTMARQYTAEGAAYSDVDLDRWFHGYTANQTFPSDEGTYVYTVSLTKDTNIFHVSLTNEDGSDIDADRFSFCIVADNGTMDWDNSLIADEDITYRPWATRSATVTTDLTTSRLVNGYDDRLIVSDAETSEELFNVPLIEYLLLIKGNYSQSMTDQEFLDREDEWELEFFLEKEPEEDKYYWLPAVIYINSWRVVLQDTGL